MAHCVPRRGPLRFRFRISPEGSAAQEIILPPGRAANPALVDFPNSCFAGSPACFSTCVLWTAADPGRYDGEYRLHRPHPMGKIWVARSLGRKKHVSTLGFGGLDSLGNPAASG
jgi:hypothetical protein